MKPVKAGSRPKSNLFRQSARIGQAQTEAFHALKENEPDQDAVERLQLALFNIQEHADDLTPDFLPARGDGRWFVFFFTQEEFDSSVFGPGTTFSVKAFQTQLGRVGVDGRAGIETLPFLDEIVAFLEARIGVLDQPTDF